MVELKEKPRNSQPWLYVRVVTLQSSPSFGNGDSERESESPKATQLLSEELELRSHLLTTAWNLSLDLTLPS